MKTNHHDSQLDQNHSEHQQKHQHDHQFPFPHHRLDAFYYSLELAKLAKELAKRIPRGHRDLADQLSRASNSVVLNLSEGANRFSPGEKRQCFRRAQGECGEVAAAAELAAVLELVRAQDAYACICIAGRVGAMLTGLIKRLT